MRALISVLLIIAAQAVIPVSITNCLSNANIQFVTATFSNNIYSGVVEFILYGETIHQTQLDHVTYIQKRGVQVTETEEFEQLSDYYEDDNVIYKQYLYFPIWTMRSGTYELNFIFFDIDGKQAGCAQTMVTV